MNNSHDTRNTVLGVIILISLIAIVVLIIVLLGQWILQLLIEVSKLDAVVIVALITGAISIISIIITKVIEYNNARKEYLAQKREKPYEAFIAMVYKVQENTNKPNSYSREEMIADIKSFSEELTLWGSKSVAEKWVRFRLNGTQPNPSENILNILEDIMNEMRADMGVKRLKKGTLLSFFVNDIDKNKSQ